MNNIYDILLNFNQNLYEVYEWNKNDEIIHIRRIPFFKIQSNDLFNIINNKVRLDKDFLLGIYKKTEYFTKNRINTIDYAFLVTDGKELVALKSDDQNVIQYSKLLYEEEIEVLEYSKNLKDTKIQYEILSRINVNKFKTRNEKNIRSYIFKEIKEMIINNDEDKLNYMYLECFNQRINGDVRKQIYIDLEKKWDEVYLKVYDFLKKTLLKH